MWKDITFAAISMVLGLALVIALSQSVEACEKDDCDRRMDKYTNCMGWHGEKKCRPIKRVMEKTCRIR